MNCEQELPQFTQEQKDEFAKLTFDFLVKNNFKEHIPDISVEVKFKSNTVKEVDTNLIEEAKANSLVADVSVANLSATLMDCGCRDTDDPRVGDPCYPQVWAPS